jgi:Uma2 family endonuclease
VHATLFVQSAMATVPLQPFRPLRRVEYDKLIELGAFQDEHIELLEGLLVPMSPMGPPHSSTVQRLTELLILALAGRASVRSQQPFAALDFSEPEPDIALVPLGRYDNAHPDRAYLIIEVAESSLAMDRGVKQRLYAACNVPEYWIVNLVEKQIEVYSDPDDGAYKRVRKCDSSQSISPAPFPAVVVRIADVL